MYHSITIGDKNTFRDWHLITPSRPLVQPPAPKTQFVDILGKNGSLDYTEALTNSPRYSDREGSWEFVVLNPGDVDMTLYDEPFESYNWVDLYSEILQYLHGQQFDRIVLEDDPEWEYRGRVWVNEWRSDAGWSRIVLNYRLEPFRYKKVARQVVEFQQTTITSGDTVEFELHPELGCQLTPLHLYLDSSSRAEGDTESKTISVRFSNMDDHYHYLFSDKTFSDHYGDDTDPQTLPKKSDFDIEHVMNDMLLSSNHGGQAPISLSIGPIDDETNHGPLTVEYWWEEARL